MEDTTTTAKNEFLKFINYLKTSFKPWYNNSVKRSLRIWYVCQTLSILCGFATAIIAALADEHFFLHTGKILLMVVPSIGSLAATVILQFRIFDLWQLREDGRVEIEKMISLGFQIYASNKSEQEYSDYHKAFIEQVYELEAKQKTHFFTLSNAHSILKFDKNH